MRLFLAIPIHREILDALAGGIDLLRETRAPVRWVRPGGMHLTVKFLGDTGRDRLEPLAHAVTGACSGVEPFPMTVIGAGAYPHLRRPRVLWAGVEEPSGTILRLQQRVEEACVHLGWPGEKRRYSPHITFGRVKGNINIDRLARASRALEDRVWGSQVVDSLVLYSSDLQPTGAVYSKLHVFPLGKREAESGG